MLPSIENLHALVCPITCTRFKEPVIGSDSHTYERSAIVEWLDTHGTSPMTSEPMSVNSLRSNLAIKNIMEEILQMFNMHEESDEMNAVQTESIHLPLISTIQFDRSLTPPPIPSRHPRRLFNNNNLLINETSNNHRIDDIVSTIF